MIFHSAQYTENDGDKGRKYKEGRGKQPVRTSQLHIKCTLLHHFHILEMTTFTFTEYNLPRGDSSQLASIIIKIVVQLISPL